MGENTSFTDMEVDTIGEILNISMGKAATAVSEMLNKRVTITTPQVEVIKADDFEFDSLDPAMGVEITYIEGLEGNNIMILKKSDVKIIVGLLLGTEIEDDEEIMDEMGNSAICEVMNQMMGGSATVLAEFLNRPTNISTPETFPIDDKELFKKKYYGDSAEIVAVHFKLNIEDMVSSEFISVLSIDLARELSSLGSDEDSDFAQQLSQQQASTQQASSQAQTTATPRSKQQQPAPNKDSPQNQANQPRRRAQQPKRAEPKIDYEVQEMDYDTYEDEAVILNDNQTNNLNLIMSVSLQISVEIGRTKKPIKDILELAPGSIVELNQQAGSHVDVFVNGQPIAKGDVVMVDDYYGVRITEILSNRDILNII